jgi:hypothetical protein
MRTARTIAPLALTMALLGAPGAQAGPELKDLQGAWAGPGSTCGEMFVAGKKGQAYKRPVDVFASAILVSGRRLTTPNAICRIRSIKASGSAGEVSLSCQTSIATSDVKAYLTLGDDGSLYRSTDGQDQGMRYIRCGS